MTNKNNIPKHWQIKKLGEVCEIKSGKNQAKVLNPNGKYPIFGSSGIFGYSDEYICNEGATIIGRKGTINNPIYVTTKFWNVDTAFGLCPLEYINGKFLYYFCRNFNFHILDKSTTIPSLAKSDLQTIEIPLPPLPEQQAIVAKIEELFSDLENGKQQLLTAQEQLKIYRQSLLKAAFEGRLTHNDVKEGELPEGWKWTTLGSVSDKIGDIDHKMPKPQLNGFPYVSTKDITNDLKISFTNVKYISEIDYRILSRKIKPEKGDIIFPRYGTIGKNILIDFDREFLVSYSCAIIKPNKKLVLSKYVYFFTLSPRITEEIRKYIVETTQANIGIGSLKSFIFPLPKIEEQQLIVSELEARLTVCDKMEEAIKLSLQQAEILRQSILKKAFDGNLIQIKSVV